MRVLALDLSTRTGWCCGEQSDAAPRTGVWVLPDMADLGRCFVALDNELTDAIRFHQPDRVVMEAFIPNMQQTSAELLIGLASHVRSCCYREDVRCETEPASTVRKHVLGTGRFGSSKEAKAKVLWFCQSMGWKVSDHNAGDAAVLWAYATKQLMLRERMRA